MYLNSNRDDDDIANGISELSLKNNPNYAIRPLVQTERICIPDGHKLQLKSFHETCEQNNLARKNKRRMKNSNKPDTPLYDIIRQQRKRAYVNTFIKKLKQSAVSHQQVGAQFLQQLDASKGRDSDYSGIQLSRYFQVIYNASSVLNAIGLSIFASLAFTFPQVNNRSAVGFLIFTIIYQTFEIAIKFFVSRLHQGQKLKDLKQIALFYLKDDFGLDLVILIVLIIDISVELKGFSFLRISYLFGLTKFSEKLQLLEMRLIEKNYYQQMWGLVKVFLFNFAFAHFLAILLVQMSKIDSQSNWLVARGLKQEAWYGVYIWAYYWGTTIMLTVGFGDITPTTREEALCIILIETISCIVLAYNVTCVGSILTKLRSAEIAKTRNMKIFGQIQDRNSLNKNLIQKVNNYIKQSSTIKQNYNIEEQEDFIGNLPDSFKNELILQSNKPVFKGLPFFKNLSERMIIQIANKITKKLTHPEQFIYEKGQLLDVIILNNGSYDFCLSRPQVYIHGKKVQSFKVQDRQNKLLSLSFIFGETLNYDVKTSDYAIVYRMDIQQLKLCLSKSPYDYEYFCMLKDKDRYIWNQMEIVDCQICKKEKHTLFKCPKLHFIPFAKHIIDKKIMWKKSSMTNQRKQDAFIRPRNKICLSVIKFRRHIQKQVMDYRKIYEQKNKFKKTTLEQIKDSKTSRKIFKNIKSFQLEQEIMSSLNISNMKQIRESYVSQTAMYFKDRMHSFIDINKKIQIQVWDLDDFDSVYDFTFYFTSGNPRQLIKRIQALRKKNLRQKN